LALKGCIRRDASLGRLLLITAFKQKLLDDAHLQALDEIAKRTMLVTIATPTPLLAARKVLLDRRSSQDVLWRLKKPV